MIDYRELSFDSSAIDGITLIQDQGGGFGIVGKAGSGLAVASLEPDSIYEAHAFDPNEPDTRRFFIPKCALRLDPRAILDRRKDPPTGSLIVASNGVSIMVRRPRSGPIHLCLIGETLRDIYDGFCITRWLIEAPSTNRDPQVLHSFSYDASPSAGS